MLKSYKYAQVYASDFGFVYVVKSRVNKDVLQAHKNIFKYVGVPQDIIGYDSHEKLWERLWIFLIKVNAQK